jgi:kinesin family protein 23
MRLRLCLDTLRENQKNNANNPVPYRESKLTHLFKTFFENNGKIRVVTCINPRVEDYEENLVRFAFSE